MDSRIGIIIPIYNVEQFLSDCLESVIKQTYTNLSIIMVDDGSNDTSTQIAQSYFYKDSRCIYIKKPNGGLSSARNAGLDYLSNELDLHSHIHHNEYYIAQGNYTYKGCFQDSQQEYEGMTLHTPQQVEVWSYTKEIIECDFVRFLDSDDWLMPDCIESCLQIFETLKQENEEVDIVLHDYYYASEDGKHLHQSNMLKAFDSIHNKRIIANEPCKILSRLEMLEYKLYAPTTFVWAGLFSFQSICKRHIRFMDYMYAEDQLFSFFLFTNIQKVCISSKPLYAYRQQANSIMHFNPSIHPYPSFKADVYEIFKDKRLAKEYDRGYSFLAMSNALYDFIQKTPDFRENNNVGRGDNVVKQKKNIKNIESHHNVSTQTTHDSLLQPHNKSSQVDSISDDTQSLSQDSITQESIIATQELYKILMKGFLSMTPRSVKALQCIAIEGKDPRNAKGLFLALRKVVPKNHFGISSKIAYACPILFKIFFIVKDFMRQKRYKRTTKSV
ncbi:hypothetical protein CQA53_00185 [Helicobacter didelphidarum]|uniref:Glycosyltransferase 2-like domain-containing protein n=1 Tax=Helicobacter didelphidarum TaxID=2040648 RepID=A0A3D8IRD1_9HELI|nr:glycosyltransferase family 2 protein [Helicobacter didelphidarum]RDU67486.1 hypothetical protein CQA53_00185 [Helicobacter didelphidarum]